MTEVKLKDLRECPFCGKMPKYFPNKDYIGCRSFGCIIYNIATMDWDKWNTRTRRVK